WKREWRAASKCGYNGGSPFRARVLSPVPPPPSSIASVLILGPGSPPAGTRRARQDPRALAQREGCALEGGGAICPGVVSGTGRCVLSSSGYRLPVRASLKCVLSIRRFRRYQLNHRRPAT